MLSKKENKEPTQKENRDFKKLTLTIDRYINGYRKAKGGINPPRVSLPYLHRELFLKVNKTESYNGVKVVFI